MKTHSSISIAVILAINLAGPADAANLFVADANTGNIYEYTPGGVQSTFASGLSSPDGLAFDSASDLFVSEYSTGNVYKYTPGGARTTFASGLNAPRGVA